MASKLAHARAWVDFYWTDIHGSYLAARKSTLVPINEVLVKGQPVWEGNALEDFDLSFSIKLPKEGVWRVVGVLAEADTSDGVKALEGGEQTFAVADRASSRFDSSDLKQSHLSYLANFPYGRLADQQLNESSHPVILVLDIAKAPLVGEPVPVTCTITSLHDVAGFSMKNRFIRREPDNRISYIPASSLLKEGDLIWQGHLKPLEAVVVTATIQFPESGDWKVIVEGNSRERELIQKAGYADAIQMSIGDTLSSYGWEERR